MIDIDKAILELPKEYNNDGLRIAEHPGIVIAVNRELPPIYFKTSWKQLKIVNIDYKGAVIQPACIL